jgi:hypothetical protein
MPPPEDAEVAVAQLAELPLAVLPVAAVLLEELEQPAASKIDPTAAADATIALDARKIKTLSCCPRDTGATLHLG